MLESTQTCDPALPPKVDKPRPHVCATCGRSFARLEHLKRHERSHTKEKPFECPQCARCFARRDLLLRHQQKLHQAGVSSTRPRSARRESSSAQSGTAGRARKSLGTANASANGADGPGMRPRANTISHIDGTSVGFMNVTNAPAPPSSIPNRIRHCHHASLGGLSEVGEVDYQPLQHDASNSHLLHQNVISPPKLDTNVDISLGGGMRTAPPFQPFVSNPFDVDNFFASSAPTINPAQLHFPNGYGTQVSSFPGMPSSFHSMPALADDDGYDWASGFDAQLSFNRIAENAVDASSSSALSTASPTGFSEVMFDPSEASTQTSPATLWQQPHHHHQQHHQHQAQMHSMSPAGLVGSQPSALSMDGNMATPNMLMEVMPPMHTVSPKELHEQGGMGGVFGFSASPPPTMSQAAYPPGAFDRFATG